MKIEISKCEYERINQAFDIMYNGGAKNSAEALVVANILMALKVRYETNLDFPELNDEPNT